MNFYKKIILYLTDKMLYENDSKFQYFNCWILKILCKFKEWICMFDYKSWKKNFKKEKPFILKEKEIDDETSKNLKLKKAYDIWLSKYMDQGGQLTYVCNYDFDKNLILIEKDCDTGMRYGVESIDIICLNGSNIKVGGHCMAFIITKEDKAIVKGEMNLVSIYKNYKYVNKNPFLIDLPFVKGSYDINDIIFPQIIDRENIIKMIEEKYENYIAIELINYNEFPQHIRDLIKFNSNLYEKYLNFILNEFNKKFDNIFFYVKEYVDSKKFKAHEETYRCDKRFPLYFDFNFFISQLQLSIEEKKKLIVDLTLNLGFSSYKNN